VITAGGFFATVRAIADDHLVVEIAPGTGQARQRSGRERGSEARGRR
jgi:preprotein translocase subunit YajC